MTLADPSLIVFDISTEENMSTIAQSLQNRSIPLLRWIDEFPPPDPTYRKINGVETLSPDDLALTSADPIDRSLRKDVKLSDPSALIYTR